MEVEVMPNLFKPPPINLLHTITLESPEDFLQWRRASGKTVEITDIQVKTERRKGKGRKLINILLDKDLPHDTTLVWAITRADNRVAQLFYEELRFRIVANLFDFYKDSKIPSGTVDAVMYGRDIGSLA